MKSDFGPLPSAGAVSAGSDGWGHSCACNALNSNGWFEIEIIGQGGFPLSMCRFCRLIVGATGGAGRTGDASKIDGDTPGRDD